MSKIGFYESRESAGKLLSEAITKLNLKNPVILAIPRGGVQVAEAVAKKFDKPIYPLIVKKLPVPGNPEVGFGAVTQNGKIILYEELVKNLKLNEEEIKKISERIMKEMAHRSSVYGVLQDNQVKSADAIILDDGAATGYSLIAGIYSVKSMNPASITVALPVASKEAAIKIEPLVDNFICPLIDDTYYFAVASYYKEWFDLDENDIVNILKTSHKK